MDCDTAGYAQERYNETPNEVKSMSIKIDWKELFANVKDLITDLVNRLQTKGLCLTVMKRCRRQDQAVTNRASCGQARAARR